ncbi:MAG: 5'/3'-nucleotidase SurE, partial [Parabacteroides sp.]|nr:5'/3'-nucleotidase SurE [Parabacteroides sp.]
MMNDRPLILITNDDGIQAKGIKELIFCLRAVGDIVVFAPDGP